MVREATGGREFRRNLIVRSGGLRCALPVEDVVRVVRGLTWHPVPCAQRHFLGLAQYGAEPLPVLDLVAMVEGDGMGGHRGSTVILGRGRMRTYSFVGLAVEEIVKVTDLMVSVAGSEHEGLVTDAVEVDGETVRIVNTERLLGEVSHESGAAHV